MIVVSHRGPVSFRREADGTFTNRRGAGGVVSALAPLLRDRADTRWIAAAIGDEDRAAVAAGAVSVPGLDVDLLTLDPELHRLHYDVVSNRILWFCFHGLFDLTRDPVFDRELHDAWDAYCEVNRAFADRIATTAPEGDVVLVQDLHLLLVARELRILRPDLAVTHFTHTPFCDPWSLRVLPDAIARDIVSSLHTAAAGFHTERWARAYVESSRSLLGITPSSAFAATFGPDADDLAATASGEEARAASAALAERVGDRQCIVRIDRIEPSKNIGRGFLAFDELLAEYRTLRGRVTFVANLNPSRQSLVEYREYRAEIEAIAEQVNDRWARDDWEPIILDTRDYFPRSVAALQRADVILVNPIRDGLNLVAMEGPILSERDAVVCLSREAGAFDLVGDHSVAVQPFDVTQTAVALHRALTMEPGERHERAAALREQALGYPAAAWLDELVNRARPAR